MTKIAQFEKADDVRQVLVGEAEGSIVVREDISGPSVRVAYGDDERSLRMTLSPESVENLLGLIGFSGEDGALWSYLADERRTIIDLMDLCDREGVPYSFTALGSQSGLQFRPAV